MNSRFLPKYPPRARHTRLAIEAVLHRSMVSLVYSLVIGSKLLGLFHPMTAEFDELGLKDGDISIRQQI